MHPTPCFAAARPGSALVSPELWLNERFSRHWRGQDAFAAAAAVQGEVFRSLEQRSTLAFELEGQRYFIKRHGATPWREVVKNLLTGRLPVVSARNEFVALRELGRLGVVVPVPAAYGRRGLMPGAIESFIVTEDVGPHQSLEDHCRCWPQQAPGFSEKQHLLEAVARITRLMHAGGICHRDFYLCHILRREADGELVLIDLHRALYKRRLGRRWVVKDLAGLYFSAMDIGLSARDLLRFLRAYRQQDLRELLQRERDFWARVSRRARALYAKHHRNA